MASGTTNSPQPKTSPPKTPAASTTPSTKAVPTTTTAPAPALVITVTGTATATANSITLDINNQETQHTDAPLPYTYTDPSYVSQGFGVIASAQNGSSNPTTTITCTITESGNQVTTNTATGPYAIAECTG